MNPDAATAHPDPETHWRTQVYVTGAPQLTVRAVIVGMLLGVVMCLSNLYVFFKTGWSMGVTITAAILAFATFQALQAFKLTRRPLGLLENNALTTVSSGAGYMTGGGNMAAFGALLMVTTVRPDTLSMVLWFAAIAALGVFAAIPIKRQLINKEALVFPTGTATAAPASTPKSWARNWARGSPPSSQPVLSVVSRSAACRPMPPVTLAAMMLPERLPGVMAP